MRFRVLIISAMLAWQSCGSEEKNTVNESAGNSDNEQTEVSIDSTANNRIVDPSALKLAYIQTDSLIMNYNGFKDVNELLKEKEDELYKRIQQTDYSLRSRADKLQKTYESGVYIERELMEEQQKIQEDNLYYQKKYSEEQQKLAAEQGRAQERQLKIIQDFIIAYADAHNYDFIYSKPGGVLYGKKVYSITHIVLKELNQQYKEGLAEELEMEDVIEKDSIK